MKVTYEIKMSPETFQKISFVFPTVIVTNSSNNIEIFEVMILPHKSITSKT